MNQKGRTFDDVRAEITRRADAMLPDRVVPVQDISFTDTERLLLPDGMTLGLNEWARKQLASNFLGIRWHRWFATATPAERADEISRRLARTPGQFKIRAWKDPTGEADGIARALLSPSFTPIDDARLVERLDRTFGRALEEYRFSRVEFTDSTTHLAAVHIAPVVQHGDVLHPGIALRNSEVGGAALTLDDFWLRLVCANGLMIPVGGKRLLYRTHRRIDDDHLAAALAVAFTHLPERWNLGFALIERAREALVPHPDAAVAAVLDSPEIPKALLEEAQTVALRDGDRTRFGVVQAITYVAHATNKNPDVRFRMEQLAGEYLAAA